jgi:hypothetical protein
VTADTIIAAGRLAAERLMTSTCVINRVTEGEWSDAVLDYADITTAVYAGPCRLKFTPHRVITQDAQGQILTEQQLLLYLPIDGSPSGDVRADDRVTVTDGGPDPTLTGRTFRVTGLFAQTYATARRLPVESLT